MRAIAAEFALVVSSKALRRLLRQRSVSADSFTLLRCHFFKTRFAFGALCLLLPDELLNLCFLGRGELLHAFLRTLVVRFLAFLADFFYRLLALLGSHALPVFMQPLAFSTLLVSESRAAMMSAAEFALRRAGALVLVMQDGCYSFLHGRLRCLRFFSSESVGAERG